MSPTMDLGQTIRRLPQVRKLTIEALAFAAEIHPTYLSGIERGVRNPTWAKLCGLTEALGVTVSQSSPAKPRTSAALRSSEVSSPISTSSCESRARSWPRT
jgi:transcriptional regulator with XRE-family HTH domain